MTCEIGFDMGDCGGLIKPPDFSKLAKYEPLLLEVDTINVLTGPYYMREFLQAFDVASKIHATSVFEHEQAKDRSAAMKAIAMIDKAPHGLKEKGVRPNEEFCKQFSLMDGDYLNAREAEAYWKAMSGHLENKVKSFERAHDDAKKIYDNGREYRGSAPTVR